MSSLSHGQCGEYDIAFRLSADVGVQLAGCTADSDRYDRKARRANTDESSGGGSEDGGVGSERAESRLERGWSAFKLEMSHAGHIRKL